MLFDIQNDKARPNLSYKQSAPRYKIPRYNASEGLTISHIRPIDSSALDNPVWSSLDGPHRPLAGHLHELLWYPSSIAPFVAIPSADVLPDLVSAQALGLGDPAYFVGVCPKSLPKGWRTAARSNILQLFPKGGPIPDETEDAGSVLGETDRPAMRELTRVAFPDFFRERTPELGIYLGIFEGERLIAMAGERMSLPGIQEISGVCTHPEFGGKGHARRLTRALMCRQRRRGVGSFLHVSEGNAAARRLYESMGFEVRASLLMCKVERTR
jgi:GNAT superfamily N-acetyltransferase